MLDTAFGRERDNKTGPPHNYPPPPKITTDTTSEGGYGGDGGNVFTRSAQRGLVDQSTEGSNLREEIQDAYQGRDVEGAEQYAHERSMQGQGLNPYGDGGAAENRREQRDRLAKSYTDARARQYESEGASTGDNDAGAL